MLLKLHIISSAVSENYRQENNNLRFLEHNDTYYNMLYTVSQIIPNSTCKGIFIHAGTFKSRRFI